MNSTYINNKGRKAAYEETEFTKALSTLFLIRTELENSKQGILNLQKTYEMDIQIISQLEVVMNKIDGHLGIIDRKLKEIQAEHTEPVPAPSEARGPVQKAKNISQ
jgi:5-bromo-4-chloroindolyl phosphate hydrolysis protein